MEKIVIDEEKKGKKVGGLLERMDFHETLYIASLEIVIFSYSSPTKTFPWALETFNVAPFNFYKVIEILIRIEDGLARDVVKHLQSIEDPVVVNFQIHHALILSQGAGGREMVDSTEHVFGFRVLRMIHLVV